MKYLRHLFDIIFILFLLFTGSIIKASFVENDEESKVNAAISELERDIKNEQILKKQYIDTTDLHFNEENKAGRTAMYLSNIIKETFEAFFDFTSYYIDRFLE